jgi:hypothetical protein
LYRYCQDSYKLECCLDFDLTEGNFSLIFEEAPDFDGELLPKVIDNVVVGKNDVF